MSESETTSYILESVNRCIEGFHREGNNHDQACKAFLAELPILSGPVDIHAYLACIGKALALGVIDLLDAGRYSHLAQMALRAWKLAHPLPPNGNHPQDDPNLIEACALPDFDTQKALYKSLRQLGFPLPSNSHLRKNPVEALLYCELANTVLGQGPSTGDGGRPNPGQTPPQSKIQAA